MTESILTRLKRASAATGTAMRRRDELIVEAAKLHSYQMIADATGLSKPRVAQIVTEGRKP